VKIMRRFGRQCRGMSQVFVTLVRQTETHVLELGEPVRPLMTPPCARRCMRGEGAARGDISSHSQLSPVEAGTQVPPKAAPAMP
jgi:hypothetical protein